MSKVDLLCIGEPMLEFNQSAKDEQGRPLYLEGHGGDTSNAAIAAAQVGVVGNLYPSLLRHLDGAEAGVAGAGGNGLADA
jgi:2-dehydro-3-deoxygluconokinase